MNLLTPINSSHLYTIKARIVKVTNESDHFWYEVNAQISNPNVNLDHGTGAPSIHYAEKNLVRHLGELQEAVLNGEQLIPNIFFES